MRINELKKTLAVEEAELEELKEYINNTPRLKEKVQEYLEEVKKSPIVDKIVDMTLETKEKLEKIYKEKGMEQEYIEEFIKDFSKNYPNSREKIFEIHKEDIPEKIFINIKEKDNEIKKEEAIIRILDILTENIQENMELILYRLRAQYGFMVCKELDFGYYMYLGNLCFKDLIENLILTNADYEEEEFFN